jgi:hypothetical protein
MPSQLPDICLSPFCLQNMKKSLGQEQDAPLDILQKNKILLSKFKHSLKLKDEFVSLK